MNADGSFTEYPAGSFYWHEAHQHYHFDDWGSYELWPKADYDKWVATGRSVGKAKKLGSKTTSCVLDEEFVASLPVTPFPGQYYGGCLPVTWGQLSQVPLRNGVTLGTASLTSETTNTAVTFDGVNDVVSVANAAALTPATALTVEAWVRPTAKPAAGAFASVLTKAETYSLQFNGPALEFTTMLGGTRRRVQAPATGIVAGQTYHVVRTYDGATQRLYVNGTQVASAAFSGALPANTNSLLIGSWDTTSEFLAGTVDEVALYAKVLTPTQVTTHFNAGKTA